MPPNRALKPTVPFGTGLAGVIRVRYFRLATSYSIQRAPGESKTRAEPSGARSPDGRAGGLALALGGPHLPHVGPTGLGRHAELQVVRAIRSCSRNHGPHLAGVQRTGHIVATSPRTPRRCVRRPPRRAMLWPRQPSAGPTSPRSVSPCGRHPSRQVRIRSRQLSAGRAPPRTPRPCRRHPGRRVYARRRPSSAERTLPQTRPPCRRRPS